MTQKITDNKYPIIDEIKNRWSPVIFSDKPVEEEKIFSLFEAARWAPSSFNEQPWAFIYATKKNCEAYENLLSCIFEGNAEWAKNAPLLILVLAKSNFSRSGKPNRHAWFDVGHAVSNLSAQATAMDLFLHQMGGFDSIKTREIFSIPETHEPVVAIAVGYLGNTENVSPELTQRDSAPRKRNEINNFVFNASKKFKTGS